MTLSIPDACKVLGISRATAYRLRKAGSLTDRLAKASPQTHDEPYPKSGERPAPAPTLEEPCTKFVPRQLSPIEQKILDDLAFGEAYKSGNATDSHGNRIGCIGPSPRPRPKRQHNEHMSPRLIGDTSAVNPFASHEIEDLWHPEAKAAREKMYADSGERQPTEQESKQVLDRAAIAAAFRAGYSR